MSDDKVFNVEIDGSEQAISLADLAGVDLSGIEAYRGGGALPAGIYEFRIKNAEISTLEFTDRKTNEDVEVPIVDIGCEVIACRKTKAADVDPEQLAGAAHNERFFIRDVRKDLGRVVALLQDIGMQGSGSLQDLLDQAVGREFACAIKTRKDKNDPDRVFANLDLNTIEPLATPQTGPVPAAGAGQVGLFGAQQ